MTQFFDQLDKVAELSVLFVFCLIVFLVWILLFIRFNNRLQKENADITLLGIWGKMRQLIDQRNALTIFGCTMMMVILINFIVILFF